MVFKLLLDPKEDQGRESLFTPAGKLKIKNDQKRVPLLRREKHQKGDKQDKQTERKEKSNRRQKVIHRNGDRQTSKKAGRKITVRKVDNQVKRTCILPSVYSIGIFLLFTNKC